MIKNVGTINLGGSNIEIAANTSYFFIGEEQKTLRPVGSDILDRPEATPTSLGLYLIQNMPEITGFGGLNFPDINRVQAPYGYKFAYFYDPDFNVTGYAFQKIGISVPNFYETLAEANSHIIVNPSASISPTPSLTLSPTPIPPSVGLTPTPPVSNTPTPTPTVTPTITPSPTPSITPTPTPSDSFSPGIVNIPVLGIGIPFIAPVRNTIQASLFSFGRPDGTYHAMDCYLKQNGNTFFHQINNQNEIPPGAYFNNNHPGEAILVVETSSLEIGYWNKGTKPIVQGIDRVYNNQGYIFYYANGLSSAEYYAQINPGDRIVRNVNIIAQNQFGGNIGETQPGTLRKEVNINIIKDGKIYVDRMQISYGGGDWYNYENGIYQQVN